MVRFKVGLGFHLEDLPKSAGDVAAAAQAQSTHVADLPGLGFRI